VGDLRNVQMRIEVINRIRLTRDGRSPSTKHENDKPSLLEEFSYKVGRDAAARSGFIRGQLAALPRLAMMPALVAS